MNDNAEQSIPSRGSHGSPVAWGIQFWDGTLHGEVFQTFEAADKHLNPPHSPLRREDVTAKIVPLYRSPTLTDEERELLEDAACDADNEAGIYEREYDKPTAGMYERQAAALRRLAERLK
jgi:hypothetical protein